MYFQFKIFCGVMRVCLGIFEDGFCLFGQLISTLMSSVSEIEIPFVILGGEGRRRAGLGFVQIHLVLLVWWVGGGGRAEGGRIRLSSLLVPCSFLFGI